MCVTAFQLFLASRSSYKSLSACSLHAESQVINISCTINYLNISGVSKCCWPSRERDLYASLILFLRGIHSLRRTGSSNGRPYLLPLSLFGEFLGLTNWNWMAYN